MTNATAIDVQPPAGTVPGESVYVVDIPTRLAHWGIFFSMIALSVTGIWMATGDMPPRATGQFQMAWVRYVHLLSGWILTSVVLLRIYLFFFGNRYASWREFIPTTRARLKLIWEVFRYYTLIRTDYPHKDTGHNPLASATYIGVYGLIGFEIVSGFALHGMAFQRGWQTWMTWPLALVGAQTLRFLHHLVMWLLWGFATHHVFSALLVDIETRGGLMSGMFSGYKNVRKDV